MTRKEIKTPAKSWITKAIRVSLSTKNKLFSKYKKRTKIAIIFKSLKRTEK